MRILILSILALVLVEARAFVVYDIDPPGRRRPNVIIILSDDQGYGDFSCHGNLVLKTPSLDRLHDESVRFSNFHVSPLCTPTRGQLLTGLDAFHNGAATVLTGRNLLRRDIPTMPEIFADNGYATGIFGKWHLGDNYPDRPMDRGFQKCVWHKGWGLLSEMEYDNDYYETRYLDSLETKLSGEYCTNLWFNEAMSWMDAMSARQKPFFTYLALNAPHGPFFSPVQDYSVYRDQVRDSTTALFLGMIRNLDRNVRRLDDWLDRKGLKENTIVVFMNDNGGTGGVELYNAGMRGKKGSNYEGGHRAACFVRWPDGRLGVPRTVSDACQVQDLLPTFIDLCDLKIAEHHAFDGQSLAPVLKAGKRLEDRMFVVQYGGHVRPEKYFSCVVWDSWRLVGKDELYNIREDPGQTKNVGTMNPEVLTKMQAFYEQWWKGVEGGINRFLPHIIDVEKQTPVFLNSSNWTEHGVNAQWRIARADGPPRGGVIHAKVIHPGKYRITLSRWPFHLDRRLTQTGPAYTVGGARLNRGKAVPIEYGCLSINQEGPLVNKKGSPDSTGISFDVDLPAGQFTLQAWFQDKNHTDLCGAYYIRIEEE